MDDLISRVVALDALKALEEPAPTARHLSAIYDCEDEIKRLPSAQPWWTTDIKDILEYLDCVVHPLMSPEHWYVYSILYDMVSGLLKSWEGGQDDG